LLSLQVMRLRQVFSAFSANFPYPLQFGAVKSGASNMSKPSI